MRAPLAELGESSSHTGNCCSHTESRLAQHATNTAMTGARHALGRLWCWTITVAFGVVAGSCGGALLGQLLSRISYDYIVRPSDYLQQGLEMGLLAGLVVGACEVVGNESASPGAAIGPRALAGALVVSLVCIGCGAAAGYLAFRMGRLDTSGWRLPNPSRHALLMGADSGLRIGAPIGICAAGAWVLLRRWRCALP